MAKRNDNPNSLTQDEIRLTFDGTEWAKQFPPVLSVTQAATLAGVPEGTIYDWASQGRLSGCSKRVGRYRRVWRDRFIQFLFPNLNDNGGRHDAIK